MGKGKVRVRVTWYKVKEARFGDVRMDVLYPVKEYETLEAGEPLDIMLRVSEENAKSGVGDFFEVVVEDKEARRIMGEAPRRAWRGRTRTVKIFPRPARLVRVGVVHRDKLSSEGGAGVELFSIEDVKWYKPRARVFVYEGHLEAGSDVAAIILETELGPRIVIPSSRRRRSSQPRPQS